MRLGKSSNLTVSNFLRETLFDGDSGGGTDVQEVLFRLGKIKLLAMDVDGTLTDAAMYYSPRGEEFKRFSTRDGMGITLLHKSGISTALVTSEHSETAAVRGTKLNIPYIVLGCRNKSVAIKEIAEKAECELNEIAYIGDDINDLNVMQIVGVCACPANASVFVLQSSDYICVNNGGNGAVREFCEIILLSQNKSVILQENW